MSLSLSKDFFCPYCGSRNEVSLDRGQGKNYELVTDCEVCCRPIAIYVRGLAGDCELDVHAENN